MQKDKPLMSSKKYFYKAVLMQSIPELHAEDDMISLSKVDLKRRTSVVPFLVQLINESILAVGLASTP